MTHNANLDNQIQQFSLIIPCFNEEESIEPTLKELYNIFSDYSDNYEIIVVNDGSTDQSIEILNRMTLSDNSITVISHESNKGYGAALKSGIRRAKSDIIVITDADGTYPNNKIPELIKAINGADMVVGSRTGDNVEYSKIRMIPKMFLKWYCSWLAGRYIPDINSGLRVMRKSVIERFINILPSGFSFTTTITISMLTNYYTVKYVPIDYKVRIGASKISPIKDTLRFIQLIIRTGTYFAPLRVFSPIILTLFFGFTLSLFYDIFCLKNITDKTILLFLFSMNTGMFALLADMIDKRTQR